MGVRLLPHFWKTAQIEGEILGNKHSKTYSSSGFAVKKRLGQTQGFH